MKSALTLWANLEAARDESSMNLSYVQSKQSLLKRSFIWAQLYKRPKPHQPFYLCSYICFFRLKFLMIG